MFGFSIWELLLTAVIALIVLGPERLPGAARSVALWIKQIQKWIAALKAEITQETEQAALAERIQQAAKVSDVSDLINTPKDKERGG